MLSRPVPTFITLFFCLQQHRAHGLTAADSSVTQGFPGELPETRARRQRRGPGHYQGTCLETATTYRKYLVSICLPSSNVLKVDFLVLMSKIRGRELTVMDTSGAKLPSRAQLSWQYQLSFYCPFLSLSFVPSSSIKSNNSKALELGLPFL